MKGLPMNILVTLIIISSLGVNKSYCQPKFKGTISLLNDKKNGGFDSLLITWKHPYSILNYENEGIIVATNRNGNFRFRLPKYNQVSQLFIAVRHKSQWQNLSCYFFEPSDDIKINIFKDKKGNISAKFYGNGANKYNTTNQLALLERELFSSLNLFKLYESENFESKLFDYTQFTATLAKKKKDILKKANIESQMKIMLNYEFGQIFNEWAFRLHMYYSINYSNNPEIRKIIKDCYNTNCLKFSYKNASLMSSCELYMAKIDQREAFDMLFQKNLDSIDFEAHYNILKSKYAGLVKELIISTHLLTGAGFIKQTKFDASKMDSLIFDAGRIVTIQYLKKIYFDLRKLTKGEQLLNTTFVDLDGKKINTESFRGKVVLIDMWNVGCGSCVKYHNEFHKNLYPILKNNKDFLYVSLNTDKTKQKWLEGIRSGKYTAEEYLNLNAEYLGLSHPFSKYYNIQGLPFILLVDRDGRIVTNVIGDGSKNDLKFINQALSNNNMSDSK